MAPRVGFEPTTLRLTAGCSTAELTRNIKWQQPILPVGCPTSTFGAAELNFCVAFEIRKPTENLLFHSDQGSNYTSIEFRKYLKSLNIKQSFSNPGTPYDNSVMESFFGSFKREALYRYRFKTEKDFFESIETYINFYNSKRPHSILMNQTPDKFESKYFSRYNEKFNFKTE